MNDNKETVTLENFKKAPLDQLYYNLLYNIQFTEDFEKAQQKIDFFEEKAIKTNDSLYIYRANVLQICLNPKISFDNERYKLLSRSLKYFENHNDAYNAYFASYLIAENYYYLQYFKLAENFSYKAINQIINIPSYDYEKAQTYLLISNIQYKQKSYNEAFQSLENYVKFSKRIDHKLVSKEKLNLLKSTYINNYAVIGIKTGKVNTDVAIDSLQKALKLATTKNSELSKIHKINTLYTLLYYKIENKATDSLDFYFEQVNESKDHLLNIPIFQLNYALTADFYLKIKKDTIAAKKFQKQLLLENSNTFKNNLLEKKILEQLITETDSFSNDLYKHYFNTLDVIVKENEANFKTNQKITFKNRELIEENKKLKKDLYLIVALIIGVSLIIFFIVLNVIQKNDFKKIQLRNTYLEQDAKALEITLNYKNVIEEKLNNNKKQIFMELHDNIVNKLFATRFMLHKDFIKEDSLDKTKQTILDVKQSLIEICENYDEVNNLFEKKSFEMMVSELIESQPNHLISFSFSSDDTIEWSKLSPKVRFNLYRIIQELIQNIHKHSLATKADIVFFKTTSALKLVVSDNGKGFKKSNKKGIGLSNINSRLDDIKGQLEIKSIKGTQFIISINL